MIPLRNSRLWRRTRKVRQFREWSEPVYRPATRFPSPCPSPTGRGNSRRPVRLFERLFRETPRCVVLGGCGGFPLSLRERAGVRGNVRLAVRTALALPQKARMALSHSFFHASSFAEGRLLRK